MPTNALTFATWESPRASITTSRESCLVSRSGEQEPQAEEVERVWERLCRVEPRREQADFAAGREQRREHGLAHEQRKRRAGAALRAVTEVVEDPVAGGVAG